MSPGQRVPTGKNHLRSLGEVQGLKGKTQELKLEKKEFMEEIDKKMDK